MNKVYVVVFIMLLMFLIGGCAAGGQATNGEETTAKVEFKSISQDEAKKIMEGEDSYLIVDVRTKEEYATGHIPGAILIPNESIKESEPKELPDKDEIILVYCRSGNRSKQASKKLADMGYTKVYEFGGIINWTGDIVTE
ncbi:MAG: rhodanese-like domain-containing protein [Johnsonella sp.]|nr:rhodanese-like domain-containing protein [Johnsonella sp.]